MNPDLRRGRRGVASWGLLNKARKTDGRYDQAGRIFHINPEPGESALVHYHFSTARSLFGLFRRKVPDLRTSVGVSVEKVPELIRRFYSGEHDWLLGAL